MTDTTEGLLSTGAGVTVAIGSVSTAQVLADFQADSYIELEEVEDAGQVGDQAATINFASLSRGRMTKLKGIQDAGDMTVVCGAVPSAEAPGQAAAIAAQAQRFDYNIRVRLNDPLEIGGVGTTLYFRAKVMSQRRNVGQATNVVRQTFTLGVNSAIFEVAAT